MIMKEPGKSVRTVVNVRVVPNVQTFADDTTLAAAEGCLDRERELDRANMRNSCLVKRARRSTPDCRRVNL